MEYIFCKSPLITQNTLGNPVPLSEEQLKISQIV